MLSLSNPSHHTVARVEQSARPRWQRLVGRASSNDGFSLPELLVVILIIGILAAIALPAFLSNTTKATDVQAKELVRNAETTAETYAMDHSGSYANMSPTALAAVEPTIATTESTQHAWLSKAAQGVSANEYSLTATATNGDELTITRTASGTTTRTCHSPKLKSCSGAENGSW